VNSYINRQQELTTLIVEYLTDWTDDIMSNISFGESIIAIESYGVKYYLPNDKLVRSAIRHFQDIINPWNKDIIPFTLNEMGFTKEESKYYWEKVYEN